MIRRPRPWPRQGRRLGPPEVWNLVCHGHGLHHVQACSSKLAPRRPIQGNSSARHQRPNTMLPQAFPKPTSPPASPSKATLPLNITGQTLGPSAFKALQACRLHAHGHGLHHVQACSSQLAPRRPIQRLFRYTPAAKHQGHVLLKVFKPAVCPPSNPLNASAGLSKANLAPRRPIQGNSSAKHYRPNTRAICFWGLQACRLHAHGHGLHHVQACSSQLAPRRPIQGNSSATHQRPNTRAMCF